MTEKWCFRAFFCQSSSNKDPKCPPTGGLGASDGGCSPLLWCQPCLSDIDDKEGVPVFPVVESLSLSSS